MRRKIIWGFIGLLIGLGLGWGGHAWYQAPSDNWLKEVRENSPKYHFVNPLLLVDVPQESPAYAGLKKQIGAYINKALKRGSASDISVYFRDLNSGRWTGVNQTAVYDPSSMLKVAVMVGYLKLATGNPAILNERLPYVAKTDFGQHYPPSHSLTSGSYTIKELIEAMITDSDNVALNVLYEHNRQSFVAVFKELKLPPPPSVSTVDFMSPQIYSSIFRTLYSSTYLPRGLSEYGLQLLSLTTFAKGLVAGVPVGTVVSHKFGEHTSTDDQGQVFSRQLHDCGIIYYATQPYLLCVMTRGQDFDQLQTVIADLAQLVYQQISG